MLLQVIEFRAIDAKFGDLDHLSFYASAASNTGLVVRASAISPLPPEVVLTGSSEVLLVLSASSPATYFKLAYSCRPSGQQFGSFYLPPIIYVSVLAALVFLGIVLCLVPVYMVLYCFAKRSQEHILQSSRLLLHAELAQQRQQELARSADTEQQMLVVLEALPRQRWHGRQAWKLQGGKSPNDGIKEFELCCLCLDTFNEDDEVRLLPCKHYFHTACIDGWFTAQRFMPRSCPQCRRNPVAGSPVVTADLAAEEAAEFRGQSAVEECSVGALHRPTGDLESAGPGSSVFLQLPEEPDSSLDTPTLHALRQPTPMTYGRLQPPAAAQPLERLTTAVGQGADLPSLPGAVYE